MPLHMHAAVFATGQ